MKFSSGDKSFEINLQGNTTTIKLNLANFRGEFSLDQIPPQVSHVKGKLLEIAAIVESISGEVRKNLEGKEG